MIYDVDVWGIGWMWGRLLAEAILQAATTKTSMGNFLCQAKVTEYRIHIGMLE